MRGTATVRDDVHVHHRHTYMYGDMLKVSVDFFFARSPGTWNPTGPDPGPESRSFGIGNPVHAAILFHGAREAEKKRKREGARASFRVIVRD